jgi:hypothetical protein
MIDKLRFLRIDESPAPEEDDSRGYGREPPRARIVSDRLEGMVGKVPVLAEDGTDRGVDPRRVDRAGRHRFRPEEDADAGAFWRPGGHHLVLGRPDYDDGSGDVDHGQGPDDDHDGSRHHHDGGAGHDNNDGQVGDHDDRRPDNDNGGAHHDDGDVLPSRRVLLDARCGDLLQQR